jgi:hypothetical protein
MAPGLQPDKEGHPVAMKSTDDSQSRRRMRGFERADGLLAKRIRTAGEGRGFAVARLLTHWAEIAGPAVAEHSRPVRITYGREGFGATLVLLVRGAMAPMIEAGLPALKERVNAAYGYAAVSRIRLTQTAAEGFAEGQAQFDPGATPAAEPAARTNARIAAETAARNATGGVKDEALRLALARLGGHILSKPDEPRKGS